jgi:GT2 family glycosyltransferase
VPRLSIVIPCPGGGEQFEETLVSVLQNRPDDCEVLVIYPGVYSDPYNLRGEVDFVEAPLGATLLELVNIGFESAGGEVVHVLQCGVEVDEGWTTDVTQRFDSPQVGAVSPQLLGKQTDFPATIGVSYGLGGHRRVCCIDPARKRGTEQSHVVLGPTLVAAFYRRDAVLSVGGVDVTLGEELADVDLALSLQEAGYCTVVAPSSRTYYRPVLRLRERDEFDEARRAERLFWKHAAVEGWFRSLVSHAWRIAAETLVSFPRRRVLARLRGRIRGCRERAPVSRPASRQGQARASSVGPRTVHSLATSTSPQPATKRNRIAAGVERHVA